jgi:hypothetical protein
MSLPDDPGQLIDVATDDPELVLDEDPALADLIGLRPPGAVARADEIDDLGELTASESRAGETDDPLEASDEGLTWIPPTDPPVRTDDHGEVQVASGFGTTAVDEPFDDDHHDAAHEGLDEQTQRVAEALEADASTAGLVDRLTVETDGGTVTISGSVDDLSDEDAVLEVAERGFGVMTVVSRLRIEPLDRPGPG